MRRLAYADEIPMKRILAWGDSPTAGTGFGNVNYYVLKALVTTGRYQVDQLGINDPGSFHNPTEVPWQVIPARLRDPRDLAGRRAFLEQVRHGSYDYLWILNDPYIVAPITDELGKIKQEFIKTHKKAPKIIFYYTVDCQLRHNQGSLLLRADQVATTSEFGKLATLKSFPELADSVKVIPIGIDPTAFKRIPNEARAAIRRTHFNAPDDSTFIFINVNRNSSRKQLPLTILAFAEFRKRHPNCRLYLHTQTSGIGGSLDLRLAAADLGLSPQEVIFPLHNSPTQTVPVDTLNKCYNAADAFITTSLGEGWGLTHLEAMATGLPVVCPDNSVFPEQLNGGRSGYLYPCREQIWVENSGYRPLPRVDDILAAMEAVYQDLLTCRQAGGSAAELPRVKAAQEYLTTLQWKEILPRWITLFDELGGAGA